MTASDQYDESKSPVLLGMQGITVIGRSIMKLLDGKCSVTLNLDFIGKGNILPTFGISSTNAKKLFLATGDSDVNGIEGLVKRHEWNRNDLRDWKDKSIDHNYPVHITFRYDAARNPNFVEILFMHKCLSSDVYKYKNSPPNNETYFLMFLPKEEFVAKRVSITTNYGFFVKHSVEMDFRKRETPFTPNACIFCFSNLADVVFLPCGHNVICDKCRFNYLEYECPMCKSTFSEIVTRVLKTTGVCTLCPSRYECKTDSVVEISVLNEASSEIEEIAANECAAMKARIAHLEALVDILLPSVASAQTYAEANPSTENLHILRKEKRKNEFIRFGKRANRESDRPVKFARFIRSDPLFLVSPPAYAEEDKIERLLFKSLHRKRKNEFIRFG
ncbi:zinc finger, c3HC4 type (RING finger) domain-containing protein [Ditylenchus destructor]|uniref:Zinc finger, c3HC4 type (RING finger) domain-containing protein n=1 Tax=Ditylenchus destructor TaxID=166010 RepID=A0AAD4NCE3_9BILA|nr:zinc finger, c3HC4 type (RING finger) domain-containing protein [Ditylenchus destructor]